MTDHINRVHRKYKHMKSFYTVSENAKEFLAEFRTIDFPRKKSSETQDTVVRECPECPETLNTQISFEDHGKIHHPHLIKFKCRKAFCDEQFANNKVFHNHEKSHMRLYKGSKGGLIRCYGCSQHFMNIFDIKAHIRKKHPHMLKSSVRCEYCPMFFKTTGSRNAKVQMEKHLLKHGGKIYRCPNCPTKKFVSENEVNIHLMEQNCSPEVRTQAMCTICGKNVSSKSYLDEHIRLIHEKIRQYQCNICNRLFGLSKYLEEHIEKHGAEGPKENHITFYTYEQAKKLDQEGLMKIRGLPVLRRETQIKDFPCPGCNKIFSKTGLNLHLKYCNK